MTTANDDSLTNSSEDALDEAEANRLFDEAAAAREDKPAGDQPANVDATAAAAPGDGEAEATAGEGGPGDDQEGQSGGSEGEAAAAATSGEGDIWADAKPEQKAAFEAAEEARKRAEQQFRSREGREAAYQSRIADLERQGGKGQSDQPRKPLKELLADETVQELGAEYPDLVPVLDTLKAAIERIDGVEQQVGDVKSATVAVATSAEEKALNAAVPNWIELAQDERFLGWVEDQPKKIRDAVHENWDGITNAEKAAEAFGGFAKFIAPATEPATTTETDSGGAPSKRERQASGAKAAKVSAPVSAGGESDDPDVLFDQMAAKKDRERGVRA